MGAIPNCIARQRIGESGTPLLIGPIPGYLLCGPMKFWVLALGAAIVLAPLAIVLSQSGTDFFDDRRGDAAASHSVGGQRESTLAEITRNYVSRGRAVTPAMRNAQSHAPVAALNAELERLGLKWRVASTNGMSAETYEIS